MPPEPEVVDDRVHRRVLDRRAPGRAAVEGAVLAEAPLLSGPERRAVSDRVAARLHGLGPLAPLLADPAVTEVMVNGPGPVWVERTGRLQRTEVVVDRPTIDGLVERIVAPLGLRADRTAPLVDARLPDGSRVHVALPPLAVDGPYLTIRRFTARVVDLGAFAAAPVADLLSDLVGRRANLVVSGGSGAGKTSLLNALAARCPAGERIVTVEDVAELDLPGEHVVRLESRPGNAEQVGATTIRDLVRNALRMRPDRLVVGEVRGAESLDLVQALNTGHAGSLATCHANSPRDALERLATLALLGGVALPLDAVRAQFRSAVDVIVQVARSAGVDRRVVEVWEVPEPEGCRAGLVLADATGLRDGPRRPPRVPIEERGPC